MTEEISYSNFPPEMTEKILENVDAKNLLILQLVCTQWRDIIRRRRHAMRRYRVQKIAICDELDKEVAGPLATILHLFESRATVKVVELDKLFDCIWLFSPKELAIIAYKNGLRTPLESIPDWWFHGIQTIHILGSACDIDASRALISRAPQCDSVRLDPCFITDSVTSLLDCMRQIHELKYISLLHRESLRIRSASNTITADDSTIDALIPLSIACPEGLHWFEVLSIPTDFSLAKVFELMEKGHFSPVCSLWFKTVHGTEAALKNWITTHAQKLLFASVLQSNYYEFVYREGEIKICVDEFVP